ncbi:aminotransferase class V-fold PLP-dependent enzyme [Roseicella aquatilis]|uniref:Aminotransferase class V-fold PLP-dependent enzyme n=1 Tax=Roseicella aquatilis TaxID=2527868 RepID=A0A4R4DEQ2_9PROT|nr:aminotransferase class V-fold PLP-dependent enzyme [Roseicella aquatilis]TCZ58689.1 aminotransferase class V-fold PLP-dependent enzyme [Roseicella aquatilis]
MLDLRAHFSRFLGAEPGRLHVAAHSHHPWPDATREAQLAAWDDAARLQDGKWDRVLGPVWQAAQRHVARHLRLPDPATLCFAPNTQEFVVRILSALPRHRRPRVLTTDGEFHSLSRQLARLEEEGIVSVTRIPSEPGPDCLPRLVEAARRGFDLVWTSEVFFHTGFAQEGLADLAAAAGEAVVVIDGYHAFLARPVDLSAIADRVFYLAGGYKYAMAGEGACFLHAPPGWLPRPRATGWYAGFGALAEGGAGVGYATDGWRFMGSTFDPSGLYRLNAAMDWLAGLGIGAAAIHAHSHALQARFVAGLAGPPLYPDRLVVPLDEPRRGNFLAFDLEDAEAWQQRLAAARIVADRRGRRLRLGFGLYHTARDVEELLARLPNI